MLHRRVPRPHAVVLAYSLLALGLAFMIGWNNYQSASPGFVAWVDEVAIASTRIGCNN